ncbi:LOW QUALITY PROTEIN: hypothetical protein PHMEG_00034245, partial [Phytophthora megakarya]
MTKFKSNLSTKHAPDSGSEDAHKLKSTIAKDLIEQAYHRNILSETLLQDPVLAIIQVRQIGDLTDPISKPNTGTDRLNAVKTLLDLLQEAGLVAGEFNPDALFEMELGAIQAATQDLYESLKILVGEHVQTPDLNYQTGSSHYASATSEPDSDSPRAPPNALGRQISKITRAQAGSKASCIKSDSRLDQPKERQIPAGRTTPTIDSTGFSNKLDEYFQMAMNRFLKERNLVMAQPPPLGTQDVDMESVGTPDLDSWEYDPDDLGIPISSGHNSGRAAVASATIGSGNSSSLIQRVPISAISELKEFTGKDMDEDRVRAWIGKVKSAFQRDQATEEEKCLTFGDLMVGSAKNWHRQLSRTTKTKWADLLENFQTQYSGLAMSVAWQYYHAQKRSEETPLDYLYRLNVAALRAKLKIKDGNPKARREHVDHNIETLGDPELADRLTLLRLADVDELEEVLPQARAAVRAIQTHDPSSESEGVSGSDGSDSEGDLRRIFLAPAEEKTPIQHDPKRKCLRDLGYRIAAARETEITKIKTVVLIETHGSRLLETPDMRKVWKERPPNRALPLRLSRMRRRP